MTTANLDAVNLTDANLGGLISEDVMNAIYDISRIPLPFTDLIGSGSIDNQKHEWLMDKLQAQDFANAAQDGEDLTVVDSKIGRRIANHSQISTKLVSVSSRAQAVDVFATGNELSSQVTRRQQELRRDREGIMLLNQGSQFTDTSAGTPEAGLSAGLPAFLTNLDVDGLAVTTGDIVYTGGGWVVGGWDVTSASNGLIAAGVPGTPEANSETKVRDIMQAVFERGGNPTVAMTTPAVKRSFSEYLFTSSARVASQYQETSGSSAGQRKAEGSFDVFLTDFGTLRLMANRLQPSVGADPAVHDNDAMYILDPSLIEQVFLSGYRVEPQAKRGLSDQRQMWVDASLMVDNWEGLGMIPDIAPALATIE